jgi:tousled-like kinase
MVLSNYLRFYGKIQEREAKVIIKQILLALVYLSSHKPVIIHYDLKPQNIVFKEGIIKVLDFGICKTIDSDQSKIELTSQGTGTYRYLPPETFIHSHPTISNKVDIWSLGTIFY